MQGEVVTVQIPNRGGEKDPFGDSANETIQELQVENVLVAPGPRTDLQAASRPDGVKVVYTLHFPKAFTRKYAVSLRGAYVIVRLERFRVIGDPKPYTAANCPTAWNMPVEVEAVKG